MKQTELLTYSLICRKARTSEHMRTGQSGITHKQQRTHSLDLCDDICPYPYTGKMAEAFMYADAQLKLPSMWLTL